MKKCCICKIEKEVSEFNKNSCRKDGLQSLCKECNKDKLKAHYISNTNYYKKKNKLRRIKIRNYVRSKKLACEICGESHTACLDFHHEYGKVENIATAANKMWGENRINKELEKCKILCSNCHRKLHWDEKQTLVV